PRGQYSFQSRWRGTECTIGRHRLAYLGLPAKKLPGQTGHHRNQMKTALTAILLACAGILSVSAQTDSPQEWVDADTGHRVVQLSTEPGSESLYFNLNPFTPDGKSMVFSTRNGLALINLQTRAVTPIVEGRAHIIMVGHKTGQIYYVDTNRTVCALDPQT